MTIPPVIMPIMSTAKSTLETTFDASDKSRMAYRREGLRIIRLAASRHRTRSSNVVVETLQRHVETHGLSRATYRHYRNSIAFTLAEMDGVDAAFAFNRECRESIQAPAQNRKRYRKRVPAHLVGGLIKLANKRGLASYDFIARLIFCMYYTAVRPGEWKDAEYDKEKGILTVRNGKYKASANVKRGNGDRRWLDIDPRNNPSLESNLIQLLSEMKGIEWASRQGYASRTLKKMLAELHKEGEITSWWLKLRIYDFRHQCCANLKAAHPERPTMVAAMMGHYSASTAYVHYGQRRHGRSGNVRVKPTAESEFMVSRASIERLRRRMASSRDRRPIEPEFKGFNRNQSPSPSPARNGPNFSPG